MHDIGRWGWLSLIAILCVFGVLIHRGGQEVDRRAAECRAAGGEYFYARGAEMCIDKKHVIDIGERIGDE